ncbi:pyruvate synthase [Methylomarinum vadi]|uniref:pyruvate synthase n=1 Tax=Methylomarinum vadi TaxID=438855 RepID=UPI0004DF2C0D|nr:pyruvate synthase [Methylomarinum vadi]
MTRQLMTGNAAAAWGARLAAVDYVPAFPITPQTEIIETLAAWFDDGSMQGRMTVLESEHSMVTAAGAAAATGVRVFTATSSQGLLHAMEMIYTVAGWRVPFVLVNVSRGLSAPITLEPDHNDVLAARDSGFLQLHCSTCQEVLDSVLIAYRLAEHSQVRLPIIVNQDGFYLSFTREPVQLPDPKQARAFVGDFDMGGLGFRAGMPESQAVAVLGGSPYSYFRYECHLAMQQALNAYDEIAGEFEQRFGRYHGVVEAFLTDNADYLFVMMGCFATKAKHAVLQLRKAGVKIGLLRPRLFRPLPEWRIRDICRGKKAVAVIDQNLSLGKGGVLHAELTSVLYGQSDMPAIVASFIGGLGGRDISQEEFFHIAEILQDAAISGQTPAPRLLYTQTEFREFKKLQAIAVYERHESKEQPT